MLLTKSRYVSRCINVVRVIRPSFCPTRQVYHCKMLFFFQESRALLQFFPGAIVYYSGTTYKVLTLDTGHGKCAHARPVKEKYFTKLRDSLRITLEQRSSTAQGGWIHKGPAVITVQPLGYTKISKLTLQVRTSTWVQVYVVGSLSVSRCFPVHPKPIPLSHTVEFKF